jgi:2-oxoglutarate decarboxylase
MVATAPGNNSSDLTDFGANDWLIEEMFEAYSSDPNSVDPAWRAFFAARAADEAAPPANNPPVAVAEPSAPVPAKVALAKPTTPPAPAATTPPPADAPAPRPATTPPPKPASAPAQPAPAAPHSGNGPSPAVVASRSGSSATGVPRNPGSSGGLSANRPSAIRPIEEKAEPTEVTLRGTPMRTAKNMDLSLTVPTATSVRNLPVKLLFDNREIINQHLAKTTGGKVSFTHLLGYAMVQALKLVPDMNNSYKVVNGKPTLVIPNQVNLGLAIDLKEADGSRRLLVPNITGADQLNFREFWQAYEAMVKKARTNTLTVDDFAGTTASLTNPGGIGTSHSVPRLMPGQGVILGVGSLDYPPEFQAASDQRLRELAVSKITTLTHLRPPRHPGRHLG